MMLRCAIVDDEPLALGLLESYVNKTPFLQLAGKYSSAVQAKTPDTLGKVNRIAHLVAVEEVE